MLLLVRPMLVHTTAIWPTRPTQSEYYLDVVLYGLTMSRVDSDLDGRTGGLGHHNTTTTTGSGVTGTSGIGSSGANTTAGPHSSNAANKLDPRVDSNASGTLGSSGHSSGGAYTTAGPQTTTGSNTTHGSTTTAGPHNSNLLNKIDRQCAFCLNWVDN